MLDYWRQKIYFRLNKKYAGGILPAKILNQTYNEILAEKIEKISIIITTRNRLDAIKKYALNSLAQLKFDWLPYEIIIIDNNSSDGTFSYLQKHYQNHHLVKIYQENKIGASAGRNKGIKVATGNLLVFMDDDCEVDQNWLNRLYRIHTPKNFFVCQGQIYDIVFNELMLREENGKIDFFKTGNIASGNMSIRKKIFDYVSFNENIILYHEDLDLIKQIKIFWPDFPYFVDLQPIKHHRAPSIYRAKNKSYNKKGVWLSVKTYNLAFITEYILKRNLDIDSPFFHWRFFLKEMFFLPIELMLFVYGDLPLLAKTKIKLYRQLNYFRKLL